MSKTMNAVSMSKVMWGVEQNGEVTDVFGNREAARIEAAWLRLRVGVKARAIRLKVRAIQEGRA